MAVKNAILVNSNLNLGSQLIQCAANMRQQVSRLNEIQSQLAQMFDSTTADYTLIEQQLGLAVGQGITVWQIVNGASAQVAGDAQIQKLITWLIQAN